MRAPLVDDDSATAQSIEAMPRAKGDVHDTTKMTGLAELRHRAKSVGALIRDTGEEDRKRSERLSSLLNEVKEGLARSQHEIKRLNEELARAIEEKQQIQAMLQTLLAEGEDVGARETGVAMSDLEDQINHLVETVSSISGTTSRGALEITKDSPATVNTDEDDRPAVKPEIDTEPAIRPSEEVSEEAPRVAEEVEGEPVRKLESDPREASATSPVMPEGAAEEGESTGTGDGEENEVLVLTQMVTKEKTAVDVNAERGQSAVAGHMTIDDVFERVRSLAATRREEKA